MLDQSLIDEFISIALYILRLSANEQRKIFILLSDMESELISLINEKDLSSIKKRELNELFSQSAEAINSAYEKISKSIDIQEIARYVAKETSYAFEVALGVDAINMPSQYYLKSLQKDLIIQGAPQADWWRGQNADTAFKFKAQVRQGLTNSETNQQIISRIVGKNGQPGVMETTRRNAAALVQTSVQSVASDAKRETFKANSDLIKGIRQVSTLDSHTSLTCVAYSGAEWDLDFKPINKNKLEYNGGTPRHFNCRSVEVPITKTYKELGIDMPEFIGTTRASEDGQIAVDTTFEGFLQRKGKEYQNEVLGVGRADLWRQGKITLRDLVNNLGRPLSLEQLKELARKRG